MNYILLISLGLAPSLVWLLYYLRKDQHPECIRMIMKVFLFGMISALPVVLIEMGIQGFLEESGIKSTLLLSILEIFLGVALIEEFVKYLVARGEAIRNLEFDEPVDVMIYMIIAALGFAAVENILILFSLDYEFIFINTFFRFIGATFLHALCSGTLGYFVAMSFYENKKGGRIFFQGLLLVTLLHGLYNFSIIEIDNIFRFTIPIFIISGLAIFLAVAFKRLKQLKSISKI